MRSGVVKSFRELPSGKRRVATFLFPDDIFGLSEAGRYVNTTQTVTAATIYELDTERLKALLLQDPQLQIQFLCKVTHELREAQRVHETFTELSAAEAGPREILSAVQQLAGSGVVLETEQHRVLEDGRDLAAQQIREEVVGD